MIGSVDRDGETRVRGAQRVLDRGGRVAPREQEPEVAVALGQGHHRTAGPDGDLEPDDAADGASLVLPADGAERARPGNGDFPDCYWLVCLEA